MYELFELLVFFRKKVMLQGEENNESPGPKRWDQDLAPANLFEYL